MCPKRRFFLLLLFFGLYAIFLLLKNKNFQWTKTIEQNQKDLNAFDLPPRQNLEKLLMKMPRIKNITFELSTKGSKFVHDSPNIFIAGAIEKDIRNRLKLNRKVKNFPLNENHTKKILCSAAFTEKCSDEQQMLKPFGDKIEVVMPTIAGFVDVKKLKPKSQKKSMRKIIREEPQKVFPTNDPRSPVKLLERAQLTPSNSSLQNFLRLQKSRTNVVKQLCEDLKNSETKLKHSSQSNIILDQDNFLTFCPIYKAASTSWTVLLLKMRGIEHVNYLSKVQKLIIHYFQKISNIIAPSISKLTTRFMIVRHPFQRLISCYRDKFEEAAKIFYYEQNGEEMIKMFRPKPAGINKDERDRMMLAVRSFIVDKGPLVREGNYFANPIGPTFEEFIEYIINARIDDMHWIPYYQHCALCSMKYDVILKFETLYSDSTAFLEYLNKTNIIADRWDNPSNDGVTTKQVVCSYFAQINSNLLTKLVEKYEFDFKFFEYDYREYYKCTKDLPQTIL